ncbi:MAG: DUF2807 domain-containing protein [Bacteroidota bacterium]
MKNWWWIGILILALGCNKPDAPDCFQSSGDDTSELRELPGPIEKIEHFDLIDVVLIPGTSSELIVHAPSNLIPEVTTKYNNGVLTIENLNTCNFVRSYSRDFRVEVTVDTTLKEYRYESQGKLTCTDTLDLNAFKLELFDASGDVDLWMRANDLKCFNHTGVATINLNGSSQQAEYFHQGYGTFDALDMISNVTLAGNNSISNLRLTAFDYLFCTISDAGNIYYLGEPDTIDSEISGDGELISLD